MMGRVEALVDEDMRRDSPKRVPIARGLVALALLLVSGLAEAEAEAVAVLEAQDRLFLENAAYSLALGRMGPSAGCASVAEKSSKV